VASLVTRHAMTRGKQRLGLGKKAMQRTADKALLLGRKHEEFTGGLRRYLDCVYLEHKKASNMRVHGQFIYLFAGVTLITVLNVPPKFCPAARYLQEEKQPCGNA